MMWRAQEIKGVTRGLPFRPLAVSLVIKSAFVALFGGSVAAQESWLPTVATTPGKTFDAPPRSETGVQHTPLAIDPRMFPSPRSTAPEARRPVRPGVWSPIVTGAIPDPRDRDRPAVIGATQPRTIPSQPAGAGAVVQSPLKVLAAGDQKAPALPAAKAPAATPSETTESASSPAADSIFKKPGPLDALPPNANGAQQYCFNTVDSAADARFAWQAKKIRDMEAELDKRAQQLEAKTEEYKRWLARRDEFARKAHEKLVGFYSRMRPDAAAVQLAAVDEEMAAAVVTKLETKVASQIMGEMDPERAAKIATIISGAAKIPPERKRPAAQTENKPPDAPGGTPPPEGPRS